jgi:hypothetical protein
MRSFNRRSILKAGLAATAWGTAPGRGEIPPHNWDKYDFGPGPAVKERLHQGPFPDAAIPDASVVMATTPSREIVPGFGMGLVTYLCDEVGPPATRNAIEELAGLPIGTKLYVRLNWKDLQTRPGRLDPCEHWIVALEMARKYQKRLGFRVMLSNPDIPGFAMPDFVAQKVPVVKTDDYKGKAHYEPRYDHPRFQDAFRELVDLLADAYNGHPDVEYVDTQMYGYWGEGHTGSFRNPFPDYRTAEATFVNMLEHQLKRWTKTPLATNTQPDMSRVGNAELVDRTVRAHSWLRTDTIFIENEQIETLSNRPPWVAACVENTVADGSPGSLLADEAVTYTGNVIAHVRDVGANYWSLWNWHAIGAENLLRYYRQFPREIDALARSIGYRIRPSLVWSYSTYGGDGMPGLIVGFANDGIAGVPGALRVRLASEDGKVRVEGSLDPGYPLPGKIRQARFPLPPATDWKGLRLSAAVEVKGIRYPVSLACHQALNPDGSLTLRPTRGLPPVY